MYLAIRQQIKQLSKKDYRNIKHLCHIAKNLANEAMYNVRQFYFRKKRYLNYYENWKLLKNNSVNYNKLQTHVAQQVIQQVDTMFQSFFALLKLKKSGKYSQKVRLPQYLPKDGFITLTMVDFNLKKCTLSIPYVYEATEEQRKLDKTKALAIDLGIDNLAACATSMGKTFIIDGQRLKSINQWYNKENSRLQSINYIKQIIRRDMNFRVAAFTEDCTEQAQALSSMPM